MMGWLVWKKCLEGRQVFLCCSNVSWKLLAVACWMFWGFSCVCHILVELTGGTSAYFLL